LISMLYPRSKRDKIKTIYPDDRGMEQRIPDSDQQSN
jgi:hypothetical protein